LRAKRSVGIWCSVLAVMSLCGGVVSVMAQAPGVEIVRDKGEQFKMLVKQANQLLEEKALLSLDDVGKQLDRKSCKIELPEAYTKKLTDREIWKRSKAAHVRVGWHYRCKKCDNWHQNLAGGYFINTNGAVATCYHVIEKDKQTYREGYLVAANDKGDLLPVLEILAADEVTDTAIIRVKVEGEVTHLPLNVNTYPGDDAWCYSDPLGRSGYFSKGMINRFYVDKQKGRKESSWIEVSVDWAPGSSGAAVLDEFGNAIGHVSTISSAGSRHKKPVVRKGENSTNKVAKVSGHSANTVIVFHSASRAADVLSLVEPSGD
jgi:hypothetical protein